MKILNGQEAFTALMAGKNIICRAVGELIEFDDLDQFPATVFAMRNYEFCVKIDSIELAGISFLKPFTLDEVEADQDIYICENYSRITKCQFIPNRIEMTGAIQSGFVQRDRENATKQIQAIQKALGIETEIYYQEFDYKALFAEKTADIKKRSTTQKTKASSEHIEAVQPTGAESSNVPWDEIETDPIKLVEKFKAQIEQFTNCDDVLSFRHAFMANGHLKREDQNYLCKLCEDKLLELDPQQYTPKPKYVVDEISRPNLIDEIDHQATKAVQDKIYKDAMSGNSQSSYPIDMLYTKKKQMLINRIYEMDSVESLECLAPAIPAAKLNPEDHQELLRIYAERKTAMEHADRNSEAS